MNKLISVVGARPQFIKAAVVSRALKKKENIQEVIIHTGQHYDDNMSSIFFEEMDIPKPSYNLEIKESLHGAMTGKMLEGIEKILIDEKPLAVLVYGDTNSTLAAALAASKLHIPVAHIEAGLRSFNMRMPEEINRILTDRISKILFCPTLAAIYNLTTEGYLSINTSFYLTGDIMLDASMYYFKQSSPAILETLNIEKEKYYLCTIHRPENTNDIERLTSIIGALNELHKEYKVVVPMHPRTIKYMNNYGITPSFHIIEPIGYFNMLQLIANSKMILTDSGGLQKEAFFFKKFCVTLRDQTEWVELVEHDCNKITGADKGKIKDAVSYFSNKTFDNSLSLYGEGTAGEKIADMIESSIFAGK